MDNILTGMKTSHLQRLLTAIVAIFSMLFMQLAVASYACPEMSAGASSAVFVGASMMNDMPGCDGMDPEQSTLCHLSAYGEPPKQSLDKSATPLVPPFMPVELVLILAIFDMSALPALPSYPPIALTRTSSPPIAIRNCCFRI